MVKLGDALRYVCTDMIAFGGDTEKTMKLYGTALFLRSMLNRWDYIWHRMQQLEAHDQLTVCDDITPDLKNELTQIVNT